MKDPESGNRRGASRSGARRSRSTVAALALALLIAACGTDNGSDSAGLADQRDADSSPFPVVITQAEGEVTIEDRPERVVALDYPSADAALALGVVPIGIAEVSYVDGGVMAWTAEALGDEQPEIFNVDNGFPFETIARLDPDVIVAVDTFPFIADHWDELNAIAPVVGHTGEPFRDPWQDGVTQIGRALGLAEDAQNLIEEIEASIAETASEHPELAGKTVSYFRYLAGDGLYVISSNDDFSIRFLRELGLAGVTDTVVELAGGERRFLVSPERYGDLEADLVIGTGTVGVEGLDELAEHPVFASLPAISRGAYLTIPIGRSTAIVQPSALSLPFALEELVPEIAGAIAGS